MISLISVVDSCVLWASVLTSSATTANPLPCSPALAASIAAFNASKLVCSAIPLITSSTMLIFELSFSRSCTTWLAFWISADTLSIVSTVVIITSVPN